MTWSGTTMFGHDGGSHAFLRVLPGHRLSIPVLLDGSNPATVAHQLIADLLLATTGIRAPRPPAPSALPADLILARFVGDYRAGGLRLRFELAPQGLAMGLAPKPSVPLDCLSGKNFGRAGQVIGFDRFGTPHLVTVAGSRTAVRIQN